MARVLRNIHGVGVCIIQETNLDIKTDEGRSLYENVGFLCPLVVNANSPLFKPMAKAVIKFLDNIPNQDNIYDDDGFDCLLE